MIDYHIHTLLCNHATSPMKAYIAQAIEYGLSEICFFDHLTLQKSGRHLSMTPDEVPFYFMTVQRLKKKYQGQITIKVGLEIDFHPGKVEEIKDILEPFAFDVIGSSVHFAGDYNIVSHKSDWRHGKLETEKIYRLYLEYLTLMLEHDYFDVVCHLDLIKKFGSRPKRSIPKEMDNILQIIHDKGLTLEINTSGFNHPVGEIYPSVEIIQRSKELMIPVTLGSDAHKPQNIGRHFNKALSILSNAGYQYLTVFDHRRASQLAFK